MSQGRRWTVEDAKGNPIYLTDERWRHICRGHPAMATCEGSLRETIRKGRRREDTADSQKFRYRLRVSNLPDGNTHIEAVVLFRVITSSDGVDLPNNYVVTAYTKDL